MLHGEGRVRVLGTAQKRCRPADVDDRTRLVVIARYSVRNVPVPARPKGCGDLRLSIGHGKFGPAVQTGQRYVSDVVEAASCSSNCAPTIASCCLSSAAFGGFVPADAERHDDDTPESRPFVGS